MAELAGNLWEFNLAKVVVVDVTDDYTLMQPPLPSALYPVLTETYIPRYRLIDQLPDAMLVEGYLYDWHEKPSDEMGSWYVGVVKRDLAYEVAERVLGDPPSAFI